MLNASQNDSIRGGSDRYFFELTRLLTANGHRVIPFASRGVEGEASEWSRYFPPAIGLQSPRIADAGRFLYSRRAARALQRLLSDHRPDVAHLHIYYGQLTASILRVLKAAGVPIVQTLHDFKLVCPVYSLMRDGRICEECRGRQFWRAAANRCNRGSLLRSVASAAESYVSQVLGNVRLIDQFIAVSQFQRRKLVELGVPDERMTTIHNFQDTAGIEPARRPGDYFLYFGRLERLKGVFTLLDAAAAYRETPLLMVGDGDARPEVEARLRERQLNHVHLLGFKRTDELHPLIRNSLATVVPSHGYDNCPLAVLESLAHARPVIGSDIGGIPELIDDGHDGWVVPPGDAPALAERMRWLALRPERALDMGRAGRRKIELRFTPQAHYERVLQVYRQVLDAKTAPRHARGAARRP